MHTQSTLRSSSPSLTDYAMALCYKINHGVTRAYRAGVPELKQRPAIRETGPNFHPQLPTSLDFERNIDLEMNNGRWTYPNCSADTQECNHGPPGQSTAPSLPKEVVVLARGPGNGCVGSSIRVPTRSPVPPVSRKTSAMIGLKSHLPLAVLCACLGECTAAILFSQYQQPGTFWQPLSNGPEEEVQSIRIPTEKRTRVIAVTSGQPSEWLAPIMDWSGRVHQIFESSVPSDWVQHHRDVGTLAQDQCGIELGFRDTSTGPGGIELGCRDTSTGTGGIELGCRDTSTGPGGIELGCRDTSTGPGLALCQSSTRKQHSTRKQQPRTTTLSPEDDADTTDQCPEPNGYFADAFQCDKYYECLDGAITEKLCPDGMVFNDFSSEYEKCDLPFNIDCSQRPERQEPQPTLNCPRKNGYFAHQDVDICDKFYFCVDGKFNMITCPDGLVYNDKTGICTWPDEAKKKGCSSKGTTSNTSPVFVILWCPVPVVLLSPVFVILWSPVFVILRSPVPVIL
uniref:Chitin-binding type-2 domain-containing protein n=1 Tax=Timema tahoe TaxID=61484 RepID=A0A7R9FIN7_9NEOP|nr:unnamed protein product [Timema tahoe]